MGIARRRPQPPDPSAPDSDVRRDQRRTARWSSHRSARAGAEAARTTRPDDPRAAPSDDRTIGEVVRIVGRQVDVQLGDGSAPVRATLAGRVPYPPVVGDRVRVRPPRTEGGSALVEGVEPRSTVLIRAAEDVVGRPRPVVANADVLVVVASATDPPIRLPLIDRALVAAWAGGLEGALVVTKIDLDRAGEGRAAAALYEGLGFPVATVNLLEPGGAEPVREIVAGRSSVLAGHSGVGKSTLATALTGERLLAGEVNPVTGRGRQTTVTARMLALSDPRGGRIVDTPGVRLFGVADIDPDELAEAFPEIAAQAPECRFKDCLHRVGEGGCAVQAAEEAGEIAASRLRSYRELLAALL